MGRRVKRAEKARRSPAVSIILCTYQRASLLPRAIRSVIRQTHRTWQLIIVDDGSTDNTQDVIRRFAARDPRIVSVRQANRGLSSARNAGLRRVKGAFVAFIDSDDEWKPTHLAVRVAYMRAHRNVRALYGGLIVRGPKERQYVADLELPGSLIHVRDCFVGGTFFLRRSLIRQGLRFRKLRFGEDYDLMRRMERKGVVVRSVAQFKTYIYNCDAPERLCDSYTAGVMTAASVA